MGAIRRGLTMIQKLGYVNIILESDTELAIKLQTKREDPARSLYSSLQGSPVDGEASKEGQGVRDKKLIGLIYI